jgi:hypothetical protein
LISTPRQAIGDVVWVFKFAALVQGTTVRGAIYRGLVLLSPRMLACTIGYLA